jgi:hypothetical protein
VLRGNFKTLNEYSRKEEKSQINNLSSHFKNTEKAEQSKPKANRRKELS